MKVSDAFPSKYLKADDLGNQPFDVSFYDGDPSGTGAIIETVRVSGPLPAGDKITASIDWDTSGTLEGSHQLCVVVDVQDEINEDFEDNNST